MKFATRLPIVLVLAVAALAATASIALATGHLVYSDEFTTSLDTATWAPVTPWGMTTNAPELEYYSPANVTFTGGSARLTSNNVASNGHAYTSGVITSRPHATFGYGYFEMRAKLPKGKGIWPAFWLINNDCTHEIDVFELLGDDPHTLHMTYHYHDAEAYSTTYTGPDFSAGYHTFAVDWQPNSITWYVDDVVRGKYTGTVSADPLMICADTAVGGVWPGNPDSTTQFPQYYDIDYIRVYDTKPAADTAPLANADAYSTAYATGLSVPASGLLGNDTDADGNALSASALTQPAHGTLALAADGAFTYTPAVGFSGVDSFTYRVSDGTDSSAPATVWITVAPPDGHATVVRFHNKENGSYFYTASDAEKASVLENLSATYLYEGTAYSIDTANADNSAPLYRFFNKADGSHFYTADPAEKASVIANLSNVYSYDGPCYNVCSAPVAGATTVWRFYDKADGSHFYTAAPAEKANVLANLSGQFSLDGPAFYLAP